MRIETVEISLHDMQFHAFHGVLPEERICGGDYTVSLRCTLCKPQETIERIAETDDIADTVNYAELYAIVEDVMSKPCNLIETVAARIGQSIVNQFPTIMKVTVTINKHNPPIEYSQGTTASVAITMAK